MRLLMCPPDLFDVTYEINAWMKIAQKPSLDNARAQWNALRNLLADQIGADVSLVTPQAGWPDMVFTANAGIARGNVFVPSRFRFAERQGEVPYFVNWFRTQGFDIVALPDDVAGAFEGEGDALFYGDVLLAGHRQRSDESVYSALGDILACRVVPLALTDTRWYHLDTCLIPVRDDLLAYYPPAFDRAANDALEALPGDKIIITEPDALRFGGNAVVVGNSIVMNAGCDALAGDLQARGCIVYATDLSEFLKSGGSAKCLTLVIDH